MPRSSPASSIARSPESTSSATISLLPPASSMRIDPDCLLHAGETVTRQALPQPADDAADDARPLVNERRVDLHERRSRSNPLVGIVRVENAADADDRHAPAEVRVQVA